MLWNALHCYALFLCSLFWTLNKISNQSNNIINVHLLQRKKKKSKADCHVQCRVWMRLGFWSLTSLRPTNGPWACLEVLAGEWSYCHWWAARVDVLWHRARSFGSGHTWSGEGGRGHPPNQPDQPNQPRQMCRRSPSHPKAYRPLSGIYASPFANPITYGFIVGLCFKVK